MEFGPMSDEASEDAEPLLRGRQSAGRGEERPSTQSRHVLLIGALVACVLWLLPPLDVRHCADPYAPEPPAAAAPRYVLVSPCVRTAYRGTTGAARPGTKPGEPAPSDAPPPAGAAGGGAAGSRPCRFHRAEARAVLASRLRLRATAPGGVGSGGAAAATAPHRRSSRGRRRRPAAQGPRLRRGRLPTRQRLHPVQARGQAVRP
eukprot:scaffold38460_cov24-Phaeocystis_antarctica.AAC.1